jgi:hypothetical protein
MKNIRCIGLSSDYRTNRWRMDCDCGKTFEPQTTMFASQEVECPKCGCREFINYNNIIDEKD